MDFKTGTAAILLAIYNGAVNGSKVVIISALGNRFNVPLDFIYHCESHRCYVSNLFRYTSTSFK